MDERKPLPPLCVAAVEYTPSPSVIPSAYSRNRKRQSVSQTPMLVLSVVRC